MRLWYLGKAVPWGALLGCCAVAALAVASLHPWPGNAWAVMPVVLAACAAASGFVFDELAVAVTAVTPRGGSWGPSSRLAAGLVPLGVFGVLVVSAPTALSLDRPAWLLTGVGAMAMAAGAAASCARRQLPRPGPVVAGAVALLVLAPMIAGPFLDWQSVFPWGDPPGWVLGFWGTLAGLGIVLAVTAASPSAQNLRLRR
jgi:hypothetical protein